MNQVSLISSLGSTNKIFQPPSEALLQLQTLFLSLKSNQYPKSYDNHSDFIYSFVFPMFIPKYQFQFSPLFLSVCFFQKKCLKSLLVCRFPFIPLSLFSSIIFLLKHWVIGSTNLLWFHLHFLCPSSEINYFSKEVLRDMVFRSQDLGVRGVHRYWGIYHCFQTVLGNKYLCV